MGGGGDRFSVNLTPAARYLIQLQFLQNLMTEREMIQEIIEQLYSSCVEFNTSELSFLGLLVGVEKRLCKQVEQTSV